MIICQKKIEKDRSVDTQKSMCTHEKPQENEDITNVEPIVIKALMLVNGGLKNGIHPLKETIHTKKDDGDLVLDENRAHVTESQKISAVLRDIECKKEKQHPTSCVQVLEYIYVFLSNTISLLFVNFIIINI